MFRVLKQSKYHSEAKSEIHPLLKMEKSLKSFETHQGYNISYILAPESFDLFVKRDSLYLL